MSDSSKTLQRLVLILSVSALLLACGGKGPVHKGLASTVNAPDKVAVLEAGHLSHVEVTGAPEVAREVMALISSRAATPFSKAQVSDDLRAVWNSGLVDDVKVLARTNSDGTVALRYEVKPVPKVRRWVIEGAPALTAELLATTRDGEKLSRVAVSRFAQTVRQTLREKGHYRGEARSRVEAIDGKSVDVIVEIKPGPMARIAAVTFTGNKKISSARLAKELQWRDSLFRASELETSLLRISALYYNRGFVESKIYPPQVDYTASDQSVTVNIKIDENEIYYLGQLEVKGELDGAPEAYSAQVLSQRGQRFNRASLGADIKRLQAFHLGKGHHSAQVVPMTTVHKDARRIDVSFEVKD